MKHRRFFALVLIFACVLFLMGDVNLQTGGAQITPADIGQSITTVGQYGLLAWLIMRSETRISEQQKAWREERRWLIELVFKDRSPHEK